MRKSFLTLLWCVAAWPLLAQSSWLAQLPRPRSSGLYFQWGYNRDVYSRSTLHFSNGSEYGFTIHHARAHDRPDFQSFRSHPLDITIPQNSYRIGLYLNKAHTWAMELNYDHAKYVVDDYQHLRLTGTIGGEQLDLDTTIAPAFMHLEHTDGANFYHLNYVHIHPVLEGKRFRRASVLTKVGAGIVVPRSYVKLMGKTLDNRYHVAGYIISTEVGARFYPLKNLFLEASVKGGFANYLNALSMEGGRISHHFWYGEVIGFVGYDLPFRKRK